MKCQYCGGDISLQDQICPHCGRVQEKAVRYEEEMQRFEEAFEDTRQEVLSRSVSNTRGIAIRLIVIVALIIASIWCAAHADSWSVRNARRTREANSSREAFTQRIEEYLDAGDYMGLSSFSEYYDLMSNDHYRKYYAVLWAVSDYSRIYKSVAAVVYADPDKAAKDGLSYEINRIAQSLKNYYENAGPGKYSWDERIDQEKAAEVIGRLDGDISALMAAHLGISQEEADSLRSLSDGTRTLIIEEAVHAKIR